MGVVMTFSFGRLECVLSAHQAELSALRNGLLLAHGRGPVISVPEYDAINVVSAVNGCYFNSCNEIIIEDIVDLLSLIGGDSINFITKAKLGRRHSETREESNRSAEQGSPPMASLGGVVGFVGLSDLSLEMAASLLRSGYQVQAFEFILVTKNFPVMENKWSIGPDLVLANVVALVVLISHADQIDDVILGNEGALKGLQKDAVFILHSTLLPSYIQKLEKRFTGNSQLDIIDEYEDAYFVDAYVAKGVSEELNGKITITSSGRSDATARAQPILSAMCEILYTFEGEVGAGRFGTILDQAKSLTFPLPLLAVAHQQLVLGSSNIGDDKDASLIKACERMMGVNISDAVNAETYSPEQLANQITSSSSAVHRIGFIGLGAMGFGMAAHLLKSKFLVLGYDVYKPTLTRFSNIGGLIGNSPAEVSKDVDVLVIMVTNEAQAENALFGDSGAISDEGKNLKLVDAPVSGGVKRASMGTLTIMASGTDEALKSTGLVLSGLSEKLYVIKGGCGAASVVKMVNQLLAGVHIASAAEAMAFGARLGLNTRTLFDVYEAITGVKVEGKLPLLKKEAVLDSLPSEWPVDPVYDIQSLNENYSKTLVVLDDDPTGTQTVHDIEVLTEWTVESLTEQFRKAPKCFFILTNSRALSSEKASALIKEICQNLQAAAESIKNADYTEADAASSVLGEMDAWIICPFFLQGGRYTIGDIHYVADSDKLVPAGDTEFAEDASFGYKSSNLREWVEEKTGGRIPASSVASVSIQLLRKGGPDAVCDRLCSLQKAEMKGKRYLCRTAASFVSSRVGIVPKAPILPKDLGINKQRSGGLIVVGSYVPKTTKQVEELKLQCDRSLRSIEVSVANLAMGSPEERAEEISRTAEMADIYLRSRKDTLIMTSRELITGKTPSESLDINFKVSSALVEIVRQITVKPRYILAKGGITSSDIATKALEAKCAKIVGQAMAGVPLWQLGPESRHPGVPYIVFPGNVGDSKAVAELVKSWARPARLSSAKELLLSAEKGGYAIGAFNVYNLEGVEAVVSAAEEEQSPAILQIHPGSLKQGGIPLVACCISAAEQASVPITVHFDHGTSKDDLVEALELGFDSVMVDGSHLSFKDNVSYTKLISLLAHTKGMLVEAELGRLSGTEDDLTVEDYEARLTNVNQAQEFIDETGIDALAVCIGNVHGKYPASGPNLKLDLLKNSFYMKDLHALCSKKGVFLVLHGASGLSKELIKECIERGVRKFNVNTEVRKAYIDSLASPKKDLVHVMASAKEAMKAVIAEKMHLFGSAGKA
ncbi:Ketose-bisphosphate aldolase, class-II [Trema orientale]|uniref:Ketose-bisphosphate aldolase, class-II n=1 Tax=Trema orientale TaxID=63057 RepID=A0A2P5AKE4_TREOI|nr:Ketose-bisphosphate aldolase, class-II [Trema orientale]